MPDYKVESIAETAVADDPACARVALACGTEQVALTIDWRLASELIDRLSVVNNQIRHSLTAPDTRADRIRTGCHRTGIGVAALLLIPVVYGLWLLASGALDPGGWTMILGFLLAAPFAYGLIWLIGWIVAGFVGRRERAESGPRAAG